MLKKSRLNAVLGRMEKMGLEQMVVTDAISILYLTEVWVDACERWWPCISTKTARTGSL